MDSRARGQAGHFGWLWAALKWVWGVVFWRPSYGLQVGE